MRVLVLVLVCSPAMADSSLPEPQMQSLPWTDRCAERLEAKRREWAKHDPEFADAYVRIEKMNGGRDAVGFHMMIDLYEHRASNFWIEITEVPAHYLAENQMAGVDGWQAWPPKPLSYPILVRHIHPRSARMQPEPWVSRLRWQAFVDAWQPLVDACLRD
jgi:hypothetical protein